MRRALLLACVAVAGCGGGSGDSGDSGSAGLPRRLDVKIASFKFLPAKATVARGAAITFTNTDKAAHTATAQDTSFDTDRLETSRKRTVTLDKPGTYRYYCVYHRFMEAEITVK